jgi:hypothetical protein
MSGIVAARDHAVHLPGGRQGIYLWFHQSLWGSLCRRRRWPQRPLRFTPLQRQGRRKPCLYKYPLIVGLLRSWTLELHADMEEAAKI